MTAARAALCTGATGFIGRAVACRLLAEGWAVHALVRPGGAARLPDPRVQAAVVEHWDAAGLAEGLPQRDWDLVVNLAAAGVHGPPPDPRTMHAVNTDLPMGLLDALASRPPRRFLHTASCFELGPPARVPPGPLPDDHPEDPRSAYGQTKALGTLAVRTAAAERGLDAVVLRLFAVYGPEEAPTRLVPHLIRRLAAGEPAELTAGTQVRDWTYVDDVAAAFAAAAGAPALEAGRTYNVCSGEGVTVRALAEAVAARIGRPDLLRFGVREMRADERHWLVGDPTRFRAATGWSPQVPLAAGIDRMCAAHGL